VIRGAVTRIPAPLPHGAGDVWDVCGSVWIHPDGLRRVAAPAPDAGRGPRWAGADGAECARSPRPLRSARSAGSARHPSTWLGMALSTVEGPQRGQANTLILPARHPQCSNSRNSRLRQGFGEARRSATRVGGLLDKPGQPFPVAQTGGLHAEGFEVIADHLEHDALRRRPRLIGRRGLGHASAYGESRATCRTCHCQGAGGIRRQLKKSRNVLSSRRLSPVSTLAM